MNLKKFERYPLTFGKTPIDYLPRLSKEINGNLEIYAKRDDCNSGLAFGGNKLRKLEYIVPDAIASGADTLVSIGGVQSNHTRMVAATAAKIGMKCRLVQEKWVPHFDGVYDRVGNILLTRLMGADSRLVEDGFDIGIRTGNGNGGTITGNTLTSNVQDGIYSEQDTEFQITNNVITNNGRNGITSKYFAGMASRSGSWKCYC